MMDTKTVPNTRGRIYQVFNKVLELSSQSKSVLVISDTMSPQYMVSLLQEVSGEDCPPPGVYWSSVQHINQDNINRLIKWHNTDAVVLHFTDAVTKDIQLEGMEWYEYPMKGGAK